MYFSRSLTLASTRVSSNNATKRSIIQSRFLHQTPSIFAASYKGPDLTQGHSTVKKDDPIHKDGDVTTAAERAASHARSRSESGETTGEEQPLDVAQQGNEGGSSKSTGNEGEAKDPGFRGSMKDQIGGQDDPSKGAGVEKGGKETAASAGIVDTVKSTLGFDKLKEMRKDGRNFHTSARSLNDETNSTSKSPREPVEGKLQGDQNQHLKHKAPGEADKGKGNASSDPHLPSKNKKSSSSNASSGNKGFHTSVRSLATKPPGGYAKAHDSEAGKAGYDAPPEALPSTLDSPYSPAATDKGDTDTMTPSSQKQYSSTAGDPPNEALTKGAMDGSLPDRNPQPNADVGRKGNKEAWKDRK